MAWGQTQPVPESNSGPAGAFSLSTLLLYYYYYTKKHDDEKLDQKTPNQTFLFFTLS